jgi:hypothetical protein
MILHISNFLLNLIEVLNAVNAPTGIRHTSNEVIIVIKFLSFFKWGKKTLASASTH